jgi:hypothetical protein
MDNIQKILVEAGRKDLAQEYYKKVGDSSSIFKRTAIESAIMHSMAKIDSELNNLRKKVESTKKKEAVELVSHFQYSEMQIFENELKELFNL